MSSQIDTSTVYSMFEEVNSKMDKVLSRPHQTEVKPTLEMEDLAEIKKSVQIIRDAVNVAKTPQEHIHKHTLDFMSNKALIVLAVVSVVMILAIWIAFDQRQTIRQFRDNDLKYRSIKMQSSASSDDILVLEDMFVYNRDEATIKKLRKQIEKYERLIQEKAQRSEQARLNAERAEQLQYQAKTVKEKK